MSYLQAIARLSGEDNLGGLQQIKICRKADVLSIPKPVAGTIYGNITFRAGAGFIPWDVTIETGRMQSSDQPGREGNRKKNTLALSIPKSRANLSHMFRLMENDEFILLYVENGRQKLFGQLHAPVLFTSNHDSGQNFSDLNNYQCQFFFQGPDNVFFYNGAVGTPPTGPAPAIVRFNGAVIASLQPGEDLDITSDYSIQYFQTT